MKGMALFSLCSYFFTHFSSPGTVLQVTIGTRKDITKKEVLFKTKKKARVVEMTQKGFAAKA